MRNALLIGAGAVAVALLLRRLNTGNLTPSGGQPSAPARSSLVQIDLKDPNSFQVIDIPNWEPGLELQDVQAFTKAASYLEANYNLPAQSSMTFGNVQNLGFGGIVTFPGQPYRLFLQ